MNITISKSTCWLVLDFLLTLLLGLVCYSCSGGERKAVERHFPLLGTWVRFVVMTEDVPNAEEAIRAAVDEMERVEKACNYHDDESELSRMNSLAFKEPVQVSDLLWEVLVRSFELAEETQGAFDPTIAPLVKLWAIGTEEQRVPEIEEIESVRALVSYKDVILDPEQRSVQYTIEGMEIDLGAVSKGFACERAEEVFLGYGIDSALIQAGGSVTAVGRKNATTPWRVGIQNPRGEGSFYSFPLEDRCVSTSGDYQNYFIKDDIRYHHILVPFTGNPVREAISATVVCADAMAADGYSTAVMVWGEEEQLLDRRLQSASSKGLDIVFIGSDGTVRSSGHWRKLPGRIPSR